MECTKCCKEHDTIEIRDMKMIYCCNQWQIDVESLRPKVKTYVKMEEIRRILDSGWSSDV